MSDLGSFGIRRSVAIGLGLFMAAGSAAPLHGGSIAGELGYDGPALNAGRPGNKALSLDGDGDYVRTPLDDLSGSEITIAYWFKGGDHRSVVRQQLSGYVVAGYTAYHILSHDGGTQNGIPSDGTGATTVQDGEWHHVAMTWKQDSTDGFASYLDGELVASRDSTNVAIPDHNVDTYIGSANGTGNEYTEGLVDDVAIWNRALDLEEIRAAMAAPLVGDEAGLVGYWNFDDGTAADLSAAGNDGTLFGDAAIVDAEDLGLNTEIVIEATPDSPENRVLCLEKDNQDHVVVNSLTNLSGNEITISCWFKGSQHRSLVRQQSAGFIVLGYGAFHILSNDGGAINGLPADGTSGATVVDGDWHHLVMTWKRNSTDGFATYLDGMPVASRHSTDIALPNNNRATYFGSVNGEGTEYADGCLDEIAIWNRALSPEEVASGWNQRLNGDEAGLVGYWTFDDGTAADATTNSHDGTLVNGAAIVAETIPNLDGVPLAGTAGDAGPYLLEGATEGVDYYIDAFLDANGNGVRDEDEWRASFPGNPLAISGDVTGVDLALYDPASVWLRVVRAGGGGLEVQWPEFATGTTLTSATNPAEPAWDEFPGEVTTAEGVRSAAVDGELPAEFFRLEDERR